METEHRHHHTSPTLQEAVLLRRHASCLYPFMNLLERVGGTEIPPALTGDEAYRRLRANTADVATYVNDLYSLEREERQGEMHNMVLVLERLKGLDRDEAIREVGSLIYQLLDECAVLTGRISRSHPATRRYLQGMRALVDGVSLWTSTTLRYEDHRASRRTVPPHESARVRP
jgi:hypothetical protein